jgi:pimeloyl-ACP methyl ester carboxylesterase
MYQDLVVLVPGFLGFSHFGGFYYFADRVASSLRGALEGDSGASIPVIPFSTVPAGALQGRQEFLLGALTRLDAAVGGIERLHLVGHSAGGVDAFLLTQDRPFGGGPADPRGIRKKIRSVVTISSPHYGTGLASTDMAQFLGNPLAHMSGLPTVGRAIVDILRSAPNDPSIPTTFAGALQDWRQSFSFLGQVLQHRELIQALRPERMAELQARCRPDPEVRSKLTCFVTGTASPQDDNTKSDPLYRDLYALTARGTNALGPVPRETLRVLDQATREQIINGSDTSPLLSLEPTTNDGIVTSACQLVHPDRPEEFGGLIVADHGDVLGHYPRVDIMTTLGTSSSSQDSRKTISAGLFHSGAAFRDDQFFELIRRVASCIRAAR